MGVTRAECNRRDRAAAYVLGELDARARIAFQRHIAVCPVCREEVDLLMNVSDAAALLSSPPQLPDPADPHQHRHAFALAAHAQAAAAAQAKLAAAEPGRGPEGKPALQAIPGGPPDPQELRRAAHAQRVEAAALRSGWVRSAARPAGRRGLPWLRPGFRLLHRPVPGPAIVGFVAVAIVGIITVALSHRAASIRYERVRAGWSPGGAAIRVEGNQLELLVEGMPRPARGTGYQVWVMERSTGKLVPTSVWLSPGRGGDAGRTVPGNYHDWYAAAVYVEPLHGPESTRSGAVVVADLRHVA